MALLGEGDHVNDRLMVEKPLGEGAYAEVYRVRHEHLGRQAMKLFKQVASATKIDAMLEEARLLSTLGHPHIVRVFDAGMIELRNGRHGWFTMEYVPGGNLRRLAMTYQDTLVPLDDALEIIAQMAAGLVVAHRQRPPILHRDLTLANVLVGSDETGMRVRLSDFGLSKRADPVTQLASAQGTYAFMAPEVQRREGYSCAADVWSLGVIAYVLLTGTHPYHDGSPFDVYSVNRYQQPPLPPSRFNEDIDPDLDRIVLETLVPEPAGRTPDAMVLTDQLRVRRERAGDGTGHGTGHSTGHGGGAPARAPARNPARERRARALVRQAKELARHPAMLPEAAEVMEEAVVLSAEMRARYQYLLTLWRRGVMM